MSKHTPGPWSMDSGTDGHVVYDPDAGTIASVPVDLVAHVANARLIASAPKLLAALNKLTIEIEDAIAGGRLQWEDIPDDFEALTIMLEQANSAITKATGE